MSAIGPVISQISVADQFHARIVQQVANFTSCQQFQFALTLKMQARGRSREFLVNIAGMTHEFADSVRKTSDHIREGGQIEKTSLSDAIEPLGRIQLAAPISEPGQHKSS